jgi:hypothetical protein
MQIFTRFERLSTCLLFALALLSFPLNAKDVKLNNNSNDIKISDNSGQGFTVSFSFSEFKTLDVKTAKGIFTRLIVPAYARHGEYGSPEIPVCSRLIEIPVNAQVKFNSISYSVKEYSLKDLGISYPIMPNQPPVPKTGEPVAFIYDKSAYRVNQFNPVTITSVEPLGTMRGVNIGRLDIAPMEYNPVTGMVRIYDNLVFEVTFENADLQATELNKEIYGNFYFSSVFNSLLNYRQAENAGRENFSRYPIKYVIVADRMFEAQLQPFVQWKTKKGFNVIQAYTDDPNVGSTTNTIKAYLQNLYTNATPEDPAPTFVLFVGDIAQVPTWTGQAAGHVTDLFYCEYTGDYFPEIFYGRFSAQNTEQLQPYIDKTLMVEQYTMPTTSYMDTVVMIAGMDATYGPIHGNGQINYGTENYFNTSNGIYSHTYLYPESGPNAANMRQNISDGVGYANYTAHGSPDGWADPSFSCSHIPALQNAGKYGLLVGNCCSTSEYQVSECFGEAIVRAANKGAVGYIGASNSTYWDEDYYFGIGVGEIAGDPPSYDQTTLGNYDRAFHSHGEPFGEWYTTMDQMVFAGNLAVTIGSPGSAQYYWEAYNLMGDPSLMVYFSEPPAMSVSYNPLIPLGSASFTVNAVPYAYVAISMDGAGLGAALADSNGLAVVNLTGAPVPGIADVVVTAQNYQPFTGSVLIASPEGPYVMLNQSAVNDVNGNFNGVPEFGEAILLDVELKNWGNGDAVSTGATLSTEDEYVSITDNYEDFGTIYSQDSVMKTEAFQFSVNEYVPDKHVVPFDITITGDARETWMSSIAVTIYAPVMGIGTLTIDDKDGGNGNSRLDPGETVNFILNCKNTGHCDALNCLTAVLSNSPYITLNNTTFTFDTLAFGTMGQATFSATMAEEIETGTIIDIDFNLASGPYVADELFNMPVGLVTEDFETGNFDSFAWMMEGTQPWQVTGENVYEGVYSAKSGLITDSQTSVIFIDLDVAVDDSMSFFRKVSCEDDPGGEGYDWLGFYIDDVEMQRWDGELDWQRMVYPVSAGQHTFKWIYNKDYSVSSGADAAWIDYIIFPAVAPVISVGESPVKQQFDFDILPNPARELTGLYIKLPSASQVSVAIYDLAGNLMGEGIKDQMLAAGTNRINLSTKDIHPGMYFCVITASGRQLTKKLIICN